MLRLGFPVIGVSDLPRAVTFWTAALNLTETQEWATTRWRTLDHADGSVHALGLMYSESPVEEYPRLHLDLLVDTSEEQMAEIARLVELGAYQVDWNNYPSEADSSSSPTRTATASASST
ncbi:VOC family protein [Amycolatopsis sp. NPDC051372]|uniref:VOC family protein n=1 Tax=unclassified Amycolatopsis TaxID=2618356 RepID=UPI003422B4DA